MASNLRNYAICIGIGLVLGIAGCYFVAKGQFDRQYQLMSDKLAASQSIDNDLRTANTELQTNNSRSTATIKRLQGQIDTDNSRFNATINGLKDSIGQTAAGLGEATDAIQGVIDLLDRIKNLIRALP